ncbi:unnamed protein product [Adineta steineri]|uniref:Uncharacterized protein n=1 Tax=Adineta steineri TaxID=433720 RepID=A0A815M4A2_9BILA|nr:unnamed protein product [Adineta steineri]CAF4101559.1 unnamed protein product [Adineta steineri]
MYINSNPFGCDGACYSYSLPYDFECFHLNNSFQGGTFHEVRHLIMIERGPFQDKLFQYISRDFPFLEILELSNVWPQENYQCSFTLMTFPYLKYLNLEYSHLCYTVRFLLKTIMYLPRLLYLSIPYQSLVFLTKNFTTDPSYYNFDTVKSLDLCESCVRPKNFHHYFPLL